MFNAILKDIRYALRMLLKNRSLNLVAIITLSLGISATVSNFTIGDKVIFRPLPFDNLDRIMAIHERPQKGQERYSIAVGDFIDLKSRTTKFETLSGYEWLDFYIEGPSGTQKIDGFRVSTDIFKTVGIGPAIGRAFTADEGKPGGDRVVLLSHALWQQNYGGDRAVLGREVVINGKSYTVIGIMPSDFDYPIGAQAWIPLALSDKDSTKRTDWYIEVIGLLKNGVNQSQAQGEMDVISKQIEEQNPQTNQDRRTRILPLIDHIRGDFAGTFSALDTAMALLVLLLCCANVANLQMARATARQKEFS